MKISIKSNNPNFSYMLFKAPGKEIEKKVNSLFIAKGYWEDKNIYVVQSIPNLNNFFKNCRKENLDKYLLNEHYCISLLNIEAINKILGSCIKGEFRTKYDFNDYGGQFEIKVSPIYIYDWMLLNDLFNEYFDSIRVNVNYETNIGEIIINECNLDLDEILQRLYILLYVYLKPIKNRIKVNSKDKLDKFKKLITWLKEDDEFFNLIISRLGGNRIGKKYLSSDENFSSVKKEVIKSFENSFGNDRYRKIVEIIHEGSSVLDLGCGKGRLVSFFMRKKKKVDYLGIDGNPFSIQRAKERFYKKWRFEVGDILYPNKRWFKNRDYIVLSDVLEHFHKNDRERIINFFVNNLSENQTLIITVPNKSVNEPYFGIKDGEFRHSDHKIEYTYLDIDEEIILPFSDVFQPNKGKFRIKFHCINDGIYDKWSQITWFIEIKKN